jgi:ribosomal protein S20
MANTKSARKATRVIARRTEVNKARRSVLRNSMRRVEEAIQSGDRNAALAAFKAAEPVIMRQHSAVSYIRTMPAEKSPASPIALPSLLSKRLRRLRGRGIISAQMM